MKQQRQTAESQDLGNDYQHVQVTSHLEAKSHELITHTDMVSLRDLTTDVSLSICIPADKGQKNVKDLSHGDSTVK